MIGASQGKRLGARSLATNTTPAKTKSFKCSPDNGTNLKNRQGRSKQHSKSKRFVELWKRLAAGKKSIEGCGIRISEVGRQEGHNRISGSSAFRQLKSVNLDSYRKPGTSYYKIEKKVNAVAGNLVPM